MKNKKDLILISLIIILFFSSFVIAQDQDFTKVIILNLNIKNNTFTEIDKQIIYNHAPNFNLQQGDFKLKLLSDRNQVLEEFKIWDPRIEIGEDIALVNGTITKITEKKVISEEVNLNLVISFYKNAKSLIIYNQSKELISVDLQELIKKFCDENKQDPDCKSSSLNPIILLPIILIAIILTIILKSKKKKVKN